MNDFDALNTFVNKKDIAKRYSVSTRTIGTWMSRRMIPFIRVNARVVRFDPTKCDQALKQFEFESVALLARE